MGNQEASQQADARGLVLGYFMDRILESTDMRTEEKRVGISERMEFWADEVIADLDGKRPAYSDIVLDMVANENGVTPVCIGHVLRVAELPSIH